MEIKRKICQSQDRGRFQKDVCMYVLSEIRTRGACVDRRYAVYRKKAIKDPDPSHRDPGLFAVFSAAEKPVPESQKKNDKKHSHHQIREQHHDKHSDRHPEQRETAHLFHLFSPGRGCYLIICLPEAGYDT